MKHENFSDLYHAIKMREVKALNKALQSIPVKKESDGFIVCPAGEYHFTDTPRLTCYTYHADEPSSSAVLAVKYPITIDSGILIQPQCEDDTYEIGYTDVGYGDLAIILDYLPDF